MFSFTLCDNIGKTDKKRGITVVIKILSSLLVDKLQKLCYNIAT